MATRETGGLGPKASPSTPAERAAKARAAKAELRAARTPPRKREASPERGSAEDARHCANFERALRHAMVQRSWGVRELGAAMGVEVGTMSKYLKRTTSPYRVGFGIIRNLAAELGVTMEAMDNYFQSGDYGNGHSAPVSLDQVETWIRTQAERGDLAVLLEAQHEVMQRLLSGNPAPPALPEAPPPLEPYRWPRETLEELELPGFMVERLGLSEEVLDALELRGEFNDELVSTFAVLTNTAENVIRSAFERRIAP